MKRKPQILVIGNNTNGCTPKHEQAAYDIGSEIAKSDCTLVTGGLGGIMTAASRGAKDANGLTIGIIPQNDFSEANEYCDVVIPTGMGFARDFLNASSADGVIIVGGGSGTLSEELAQKCNPIQLVANIINNAAWLVTNGASDIEEIEKAAQLGLGLKKPLFETAKEIGIKNIVDELNKLAEEHGEFYKPDPLLLSMQ